MNFSIVTPSMNQGAFLSRCLLSVVDQCSSNDSMYHHVQDAESIDTTQDQLERWFFETKAQKPEHYSFGYVSEPDEGMYDAINKGIKHCLGLGDCGLEQADSRSEAFQTSNLEGTIIAWLNCDEQYLPGTLGKVAEFFKEHPETDILFGGMLVVDENGELLSCRKAMPMRKTFLEASYLYNFSCAMFFRRSLWEKLGGFDTAYKNAGDEDLIRRALSAGTRTAVLDEYLSTFTYRTDNLSSDPKAADEHARLKGEDGLFVRSLKPLINLMRLAEKWMRGGHRQTGPIEYDIYFNGSEKRQHFVCENPTTRWPDHAYPYLLRHRLNR